MFTMLWDRFEIRASSLLDLLNPLKGVISFYSFPYVDFFNHYYFSFVDLCIISTILKLLLSSEIYTRNCIRCRLFNLLFFFFTSSFSFLLAYRQCRLLPKKPKEAE